MNYMNYINKNLVIIFIIGIVIGGAGFYFYQNQNNLSLKEAADKAINFINLNIDKGATASLLSVSQEGNVYKIHLKINEAEYDSYITKDGKFLFPSGFNLEEQQPTAEVTAEATNTQETASLDDFAQCLTDKGVKFYGTTWCGHCANQKKMFGDAMQFVNYIECWDSQTNKLNNVCAEAKIEGFPTWEFADGRRESGEVSLEKLSEISGCPIK